jgi:hypothetical protein
MITRSSSSSRTVTFLPPFFLTDFDTPAPAGDYVVDTEEEEVGSILFPARRRISTTIRLRVAGATECRQIDPLNWQRPWFATALGQPRSQAIDTPSGKDRAERVRRYFLRRGAQAEVGK